MQILYIVLGVILAIAIAVFHYYKNLKNKERVSYLLTFLRFVSLLALFLLFINPKIEQRKIEIVKPILAVAIDNSKSIASAGQSNSVIAFVDNLKSNVELNNKFKLDYYSFGSNVETLDTLFFKDTQTDISKPLQQFKSIYKEANAPILLITDGNQTIGSSFEFKNIQQPVFSVVVGDTIKYTDVFISQLNVNRYTYLKNKFPVEVYLNYDGKVKEETQFSIFKGNQKVYSEKIIFDENKTSKKTSFHLPTTKVGTHYYTAVISTIDGEKNTTNNTKEFVVEVIDEQSKTLLLTSLLHPDIGALKESIESNKQRTVEVKVIGDSYNLEDYESVILYQPISSFKPVFKQIEKQQLNYAIITGTKTDWNFLNKIQSNFSKKVIQQTENYQPIFNPSFSSFSQSNIGFESFPPLIDKFGTITFTVPFETMLWQQVNGFLTEQPLLATYETQKSRAVVLFGENSWRWRMTSQLENKSFIDYDNFTAKIMQYLSFSKNIKRLKVDYKPLYYATDVIRIDASYLDKNYQFDSSATLWLSLINQGGKEENRFPFSLVGNNYQIDVQNINAGTYSFVVSVENQTAIQKGNFKVINFDAEKQFYSANIDKLKITSNKSEGAIYYLNNTKLLIDDLIADTRFASIQKMHKKLNSLIDWKWLLGLITLSLSIEWFVRKYKGFI